MADQEATVTASQIARLAGVTAAAVSNWRRRFDDFPKAVASAPGGRDLFRLSEVDRWLRDHNRLPAGTELTRLLWSVADSLRAEGIASAGIPQVLCTAIALTAWGRDRSHGAGEGYDVAGLLDALSDASPEEQDLFQPIREISKQRALSILSALAGVERDVLPDLFESVLGTRRERRDTESQSSERILSLVERLIASPTRGPESVFDPAAGTGGFLLAAAQLWSDDRSVGTKSPVVGLFGQEINRSAWRTAKQRFLVHGYECTLVLGDSLREDAFSGQRFDLVVADPPYGQRLEPFKTGEPDSRWVLGERGGKNADLAWLQHVIAHVSDRGWGYVLLPHGALFRGGREADVRRELVRRGAISAVVALPPYMGQHTSVPLSLVMVRALDAQPDSRDARVLFVDAMGADGQEVPGPTAPLIDLIGDVLSRWQAGGEPLAGEEEDEEGFAATVPMIELLDAEASLLPSRWVRREVTADEMERRREALLTALQNLASDAGAADQLALFESVTSRNGPRRWIPVSNLVKDDRVSLIRGVRVPPEDCLPAGVRVLRTRDIGSHEIDYTDEPCFVDPEGIGPKAIVTEPGDIIVSPASGRLRAVVDEEGGRVLATPLQGVRLVEDALDPYVVAAFLASPRNRRFVTGTAYARVDVRQLEFPLLSLAEADRVREALRVLASYEQDAAQLGEAASALREALLDA